MKVGTDADAGDELEDDDAGPGFVVGKVDEETEAEGHEEHTEPDRREVLACFLNEDAGGHGGD